jgi:hypothetical protein
MPESEPKASGNRSIMKFVAAAAAMAVLAGCAVAVPLPPFATSSQDSRNHDSACTGGSKCRNGHQVAYRHSQPVGGGKIDDDPPDFILNSGDQDGTPPTRSQMK